MTADASTLLAVDVGNSRVKAGLFVDSRACAQAAQGGMLPITVESALPEPAETFAFASPALDDTSLAQFTKWLGKLASPPQIAITAAVHRSAGQAVVGAVQSAFPDSGAATDVRTLQSTGLPIEVRVDEPSRVGVDRLLACIAANRLRADGRPAIVVDLGTAITVDLVSPDGAFEGGAILPGVRMASRALHQQTDALPDIPMEELDASVPAVGKATDAALRAGLYWGAVGAVREIIARQRDGLTVAPQVFLTGGAAPPVARLLGSPEYTVRHVRDLVLAGIAITAESDPRPAS